MDKENRVDFCPQVGVDRLFILIQKVSLKEGNPKLEKLILAVISSFLSVTIDILLVPSL
ncbi:hypothetical protein [Mesobacillus maritimus]|uniref:hypothetical protein n=1 Tax=Mesobacillus maritimus TaxID=1643336 RepID=UPI00384C6649